MTCGVISVKKTWLAEKLIIDETLFFFDHHIRNYKNYALTSVDIVPSYVNTWSVLLTTMQYLLKWLLESSKFSPTLKKFTI